MSLERTIRYTGKEVTVLWKQHLCVHSKKCWQNLPAVFKPGERPWIHPDGAEGSRIIEQVRQCPSGALSIAERAATEETNEQTPAPGFGVQPMSDETTTIELALNGPLLVKGTIHVKHADGRVEVKETKCALCRCGASGNKPYCDGSHRTSGFQG